MGIVMISLSHILLLLLITCCAPVLSTSSSRGKREDYDVGFFDLLHAAPPQKVRSRTKPGSSVVEVTLLPTGDADDNGTIAGDNEDSDGENDEGEAEEVYRLCHLVTMLPISDEVGRPMWDYALNCAAAALLAVRHFNQRHGGGGTDGVPLNTRVVPDLATDDRIRNCNVRLTLEHGDTRRSSIAANRFLVDDLLSRDDGFWPAIPRPTALVGASLSPISASLSVLASNNRVPVISPLSQSSSLDNKGIYGLFGRTNPGSIGDARAAASYLREVMNVTHCAVLFVRDLYGSAYSADFERVASFELDPPMIDVTSIAFAPDGNAESIRFALDRLADSGFNYIFVVAHFHHIDGLVREATRRGMMGKGGGNKFWFFPYQPSSDDDEVARSMSGSTFLSFDFEPNDDFEEAWRTLEEDEALKEYFVASQPDYLDLDKLNFTFPSTPSLWEALTYDAVMALGFAACSTSEYLFDGPDLFDAFTNTSFSGASGEVGFDPSTGSRLSSQVPYRVSNIVATTNGRDDDPGEGRDGERITLVVREVAHQVRSGGDGGSGAMRWVTTNPTTYSDGSNVAPPVLPPPTDERTHPIGKGVIAFGLILAGLGAAASIFWGGWTVLRRDTRVVRSSQPQFLLMLCAGSFVMSCSIVPMAFHEPGDVVGRAGLDVACMAFPWLFSLGWVVSFSALFSKTLRIYKLMKMSKSFCRVTVEPRDVLLPFLVLFTCNVVVLLTWTLVAPLRWERVDVESSVDSFGRVTESYATCLPPSGRRSAWPCVIILALINVGCLIYAVFVSYRARYIDTEYRETHYIAISVLSILQAFVVGTPVLAVASQSPSANFVTWATIVAIVCFAVLIPMFSPKAQALRNEKDARNLKSLIREQKEKRVVLIKKNLKLRDELNRSKNMASLRKNDILCASDVGTDLWSSISISTHNTFGEDVRRREAWAQESICSSVVSGTFSKINYTGLLDSG